MTKGSMVASGDDVSVAEAPQASALLANTHLKIETLYLDDSLLIVNKPGLVPCHPLNASEHGTVINALVALYPEIVEAGNKPLEGGLLHRLDNGTSGALIIARKPNAFDAMRTALRRGAIDRRYLALCAGDVEEQFEIATPIAHHPKNRRKMITFAFGAQQHSPARPAATVVRRLRRFRGSSLLEVRPRTGRRHQVRVHLASIGHPLIGDALYGGPAAAELAPGRFWLHLSEVAFESPSNGWVTVRAPIPGDLDAVIQRLSFY